MKNLKLFPKTFLVSIGLFAALIILVHALVYTLMPQFYLQQKEREAADNLITLTTELRGKSAEEMRRISQEFAQVKNVNITLTIDGRDQYFQGFQSINIVTDSGKSVDTSVVKITDGQTVDPHSVILRQGSVVDNQGRKITVKMWRPSLRLNSLPCTYCHIPCSARCWWRLCFRTSIAVL